ncbi:MAG: DnaJ domain-containing protein [Acidiferrobacterales bacterium]
MLVRLAVALLILVVIYFVLRWFVKTPPKTVARVLRRVVIGAAIGTLILLAATGRLHWLFALIGSLIPLAYRLGALLGLVPLFQRLRAMHQTMGSAHGPSAGQRSGVQTRYLRMSLDHDTGAMDGEVLEGRFRGSHLGMLDLSELLVLREECQTQDPHSVPLIEAYLDRLQTDWRERHTQSSDRAADTAASTMTREQAYEILGLAPGASEDEIVETHRRLMQKLHPDRGGSTYIAAQLNKAKDILLGR